MRIPALIIADADTRDAVFEDSVLTRLEAHLAFVAPPQSAETHAALGGRLEEVEVIVSSWGMPRMDEAFLQHYPSLRIVFHAAGSVRSFVTDASWARGVRVATAVGVNAQAVADFTCAQIHLSLKRAFHFMSSARRRKRRDREGVTGAHGRTVGLLGLGHIGRIVAERLRPIEPNLLVCDPFVTPAAAAALGVEIVSLEDVFARADVVSCHLPLLPDTRRIIQGRHFRLMKPGATFINTARGGVVADDEMIAALQERPDLQALLDVTDPEPPTPGSLLYELPNIALTPHIAGCQGSERALLGHRAAEDVARYARGEEIPGELTPERVRIMA